MTFLLDTDTLIFLVRGMKVAVAKNESQRLRREIAERILLQCKLRQGRGDILALSAITAAELEYGARHSADYSSEAPAVRKILRPFVIYDFDGGECARSYGEVRET